MKQVVTDPSTGTVESCIRLVTEGSLDENSPCAGHKRVKQCLPSMINILNEKMFTLYVVPRRQASENLKVVAPIDV